MNQVVLKAENLKMHFPIHKGLIFRKETGRVRAVDGISLHLKEGETLGLVGESGCGKSSFGRTIMRLYQPTSGKIELCGRDITKLSQKELLSSRIHCQMIFQDPYASLNPRMTVFDIISEPIKNHKLIESREDLEKRVRELMEMVGLSPRYIRKYPHEFSGGQRQRIAVARAIAMNPKVIVCDEPVSALDVSIQSQIINLLKDLQRELNLAYVFIAHDISVVRHISDRVAVMYLGKIVEIAETEELFRNPQHPYTRALLSAVPLADPDKERKRERILLKGDLPSPINPPAGCSFNTRCPLADKKCSISVPDLVRVGSHHQAACLKINGA